MRIRYLFLTIKISIAVTNSLEIKDRESFGRLLYKIYQNDWDAQETLFETNPLEI